MGHAAFPTLGFDPCPGDPAGVTALAGSWQDAAFLLTEIALRLDGTDAAQARWQGRAATTFRSRLGGNRATLGKLRASYEHNADLLTRWAGRLTDFQTEAAALEARAATADEQRRRRLAGALLAPAPPAGPTPGEPGPRQCRVTPADPDASRTQVSGIRTQAEALHERYLAAARALARELDGLLDLPAGITGWYGTAADTAREAALLRQEAGRAGGPVPRDPALRAAWWSALTPAEQAAVVREYATGPVPPDVTATTGLPAVAADRLNRARLRQEVARPGCPQRLRDLWTYLSDPTRPGMYLLGFDDIGNGHVAVSFGDPDTAANTAVYVPGTGATLAKASGDLDRALTMYRSAYRRSAGSTASVYWLGYDAPGWSVPGPASQSFADAGAPRLAAFVNALATTHQGSGHVTVIGHSYGSTLVGDAFAHAGMRADDAVFVGSPGVTVDRASQLGLDPGHVWASKAKFDPVPDAAASKDPLDWLNDHSAWFGNDPTSSAFGGRTFDSGEGTWVGHAHSEYWDGGPALDNMTDIVVGRTGAVTAMPTEDKVGALPDLADLVVAPAAVPDIGGAALQNLGHAVGGYWGAPIEDAGDALHEVGQAENNAISAGTDLLTGDVDGSLDDVRDIGGDLADSGRNAVKTVTDFF